jgi:acyl-CoA synthetase (AMP-forming)/AMP-acid ligase II
MNQKSNNIASVLPVMARQQPDTVAIVVPGLRGKPEQKLTYLELEEKSSQVAFGLQDFGIGRGVRTGLLVTPGIELFILCFGLFKAGAVPVLVDPGIGIKRMKSCLGKARPSSFIGISKAHVARLLLGWGKPTVKLLVTVGRRWFWGGTTLSQLMARGRNTSSQEIADPGRDDLAAVIFTSGSTGPPKGVEYRHGNFLAQVDAIRDMYGIEPGEVDLPTFPLFALFDPAMGMTSVIPHMDPTRPGTVHPPNVIEPIQRFKVTHMFGSPALINRVGRYGEKHDVKLPSLRRVLSAGAPVSPAVLERFSKMLSDSAEIHTPYGATESLPVASIGSNEILEETAEATNRGKGVCVGRPVPCAEVSVIRLTDDAITSLDHAQINPPGEIGEIVIGGPMVTQAYFEAEKQNQLAKIPRPDGTGVMHRMGDLGYFDESGRLWFCGRKSQRVETADGPMFTVPCEAIFNMHPAVFRSALVGVTIQGEARPVIIVELEKQKTETESKQLFAELRELALEHEHTQSIESFLVHPSFPVDVRHNSKIGREKLTIWAQRRLT